MFYGLLVTGLLVSVYWFMVQCSMVSGYRSLVYWFTGLLVAGLPVHCLPRMFTLRQGSQHELHAGIPPPQRNPVWYHAVN